MNIGPESCTKATCGHATRWIWGCQCRSRPVLELGVALLCSPPLSPTSGSFTPSPPTVAPSPMQRPAQLSAALLLVSALHSLLLVHPQHPRSCVLRQSPVPTSPAAPRTIPHCLLHPHGSVPSYLTGGTPAPPTSLWSLNVLTIQCRVLLQYNIYTKVIFHRQNVSLPVHLPRCQVVP